MTVRRIRGIVASAARSHSRAVAPAALLHHRTFAIIACCIHARPTILHRDLKPSNILISEAFQVKITGASACGGGRPRRVRAAAHAVRTRADFGISRITADGADDASTICGTPKWIAPEVRRRASERY